MKNPILPLLALSVLACASTDDQPVAPQTDPPPADFDLTAASATYDEELGHVVFTIDVAGAAGATVPTPAGQLDGAPVLGYVFPTTLSATDVGFSATEGIVALALTSHPDFDDTPLFDEDANRDFADDGRVWHPHWVILIEDPRVGGGLAVRQFDADDSTVTLPPTNPGMPMYMDSPGFNTVTRGSKIHCVVPLWRMNNRRDFNFDGVAARMQVNTSDPDRPLLGVYEVWDVASGDLSLPYTVE